jgi:hypothetical protein
MEQARSDYYAYFCEEAMRFYVPYIMERKEGILTALREDALRYPYKKTASVSLIHTKTYYSGTNRRVRRYMEDQLTGTGAWFQSLSGLNRANIYAIFMNSNFEKEMNKMLGGGLYLGLDVSKAGKEAGVDIYDVRMTINLNLQ